jgi:hypothetical protein
MSELPSIAAALALSHELGGAEVTMATSMAPDVAVALGREIRAGLGDGPGLRFRRQSVTVTGDPPRVEAITIAVASADEDDEQPQPGHSGARRA